MPIQYEGILAEHEHTRSRVCVFDICHMGEFRIEGDCASCGLDRIITQNIASMPQGSCRYGFMLNERGGIVDDLLVYRLKEDSWMLVVNAATIQSDEAHLKSHLTRADKLKNISSETGKLDVQGPHSQETLEDIFGKGIAKLGYYTFAEFSFNGKQCLVSRTGYTGEPGYEIYIGIDSIRDLWELLLKNRRVKPAGLGCRDTLRLEMGYPLYGQDIDENHSPVAAGLEKFVDFSKDFIGKEALLKEQKNGPDERLILFKADSRRAPRHGFGIFRQENRVGTVTSGSFSPSLSRGIGMGYVCKNYKTGEELVVKGPGVEIPVTIAQKPFYTQRKR